MSTATVTATRTETITTAETRKPRRAHLPGQKPFGPLRITAFVVLLLLAVGWLLPFLWAVATSFKTETAAAATPVTWLPPDGFTTDGARVVMWTGPARRATSGRCRRPHDRRPGAS